MSVRFVMRVFQWVNYFLPSVGGTQLATYHLSKEIAKQNVHVRILTFNVNPLEPMKTGYFTMGLPSFERISGVPVYRLPVLYIGKTTKPRPLYKIIVSLSAVRMILREKPDVVHFQGANEVLQAIIVFFASIFSGSKTVLTTHGLHEQIRLFRKRGVSRWVNEAFLRIALGMANNVIALSNSDIAPLSFLGVPLAKIYIIPNGIDLSKYSPSPLGSQPAGRSLVPDGPFVLCVARIRENKGIESLMKAAANIISKRPDVKFVVVGNRSESYALKLDRLSEKLGLEKNFLFTGYVKDESDVIELYKAACAFVLPSFMESLPLVLLEALASGLPVVATRVGGIPELISSSEGILVAPGDVDGLSSSLLFLLENDAARIRMGQNARKKAESYSWRKIGQRTISLYAKLLKKENY
jgi:glycosyltransferase involved in cell wall biosynthesis